MCLTSTTLPILSPSFTGLNLNLLWPNELYWLASEQKRAQPGKLHTPRTQREVRQALDPAGQILPPWASPRTAAYTLLGGQPEALPTDVPTAIKIQLQQKDSHNQHKVCS